MSGRTFFRIMIDNLFINNALSKAIVALVNFCNEQSVYGIKKLKFSKKIPLNNTEQDSIYNKRFIFNSNQTSGANYK